MNGSRICIFIKFLVAEVLLKLSMPEVNATSILFYLVVYF